MKCSECGKELTAEEQKVGACSSCGKVIKVDATPAPSPDDMYETFIGKALKIVGIIIIIGGCILSYGTSFLYCAVSIISGLLIAGVGEIINLLYTICKKMK